MRGQEGDAWKGEVADPETPEHLGRSARQDWINRKYMPEEKLTPQAQTFAAGLEFLETNRDQDNWYLQIETFDPHEPFFTLKQWKDRYNYEWESLQRGSARGGPSQESLQRGSARGGPSQESLRGSGGARGETPRKKKPCTSTGRSTNGSRRIPTPSSTCVISTPRSSPNATTTSAA